MAQKRTICLCCNAFVVCVGIVLLFLGGFFPRIVDKRIDEEVEKTLQIKRDFADWDAQQRQDFIKVDSTFNYYAFNITNPTEVLAGAKPAVQQVGPYKTTETSYKYNISWNSAGDIVSYNLWWYKVWDTPAAYTDKINVLNPAYFGALYLLPNVSSGVSPNGVSRKESSLLPSLQPLVHHGLRDTFLVETGPFLSAVRIQSVLLYLQTVQQLLPSLGVNDLNTLQKISAQWGNLAHRASGLKATNAVLAGFELPSSTSNSFNMNQTISNASALHLWTSTNTISLLNSQSNQGINMWLGLMTLIQAGDTSGQSALITSMVTASGGVVSANDIIKVATWLNILTLTNEYAASYRAVTLPAYATLNPTACAGLTGASTWTDAGAAQFSRGCIVRTATNNTLHSNPLLCNSPQTATGRAIPGCVGPELYSYLVSDSLISSTFVESTLAMTITKSKAFLNLFNPGQLNFNETAGFVFYQFGLAVAGQGGSFAPINNSVFWNAGFPVLPTTCTLSDLTCYTTLKMINYLTEYAPNTFGMIPEVFFKNGGLFTNRSPNELLFGFKDDPLLSKVNQVYPGLEFNYTSQEDHYSRTKQLPYGLYTGVTDINRARHFFAWRGAEAVQNVTSLGWENFGYCFCKWTAAVNSSVLNQCQLTCDPTWTSPADVKGESTGGFISPFSEDEIIPSVSVFTPEGMRSLTFNYEGEREVKGIKVRRYVLNKSVLYNATVNPKNAQFQMGDTPSGVAPMYWFFQGQVPIYVSTPNFAGGYDERLFDQVTGLDQAGITSNFNLEDYDTYIDFEPLSGAAMFGHKRIQSNLLVDASVFDNSFHKDIFNSAPFEVNGRKVYYWPVFWIDVTDVISDSDASDFRSGVYDNRDLAKTIQLALLAVGGTLFLVGTYLAIKWLRRDPDFHHVESSLDDQAPSTQLTEPNVRA